MRELFADLVASGVRAFKQFREDSSLRSREVDAAGRNDATSMACSSGESVELPHRLAGRRRPSSAPPRAADTGCARLRLERRHRWRSRTRRAPDQIIIGSALVVGGTGVFSSSDARAHGQPVGRLLGHLTALSSSTAPRVRLDRQDVKVRCCSGDDLHRSELALNLMPVAPERVGVDVAEVHFTCGVPHGVKINAIPGDSICVELHVHPPEASPIIWAWRREVSVSWRQACVEAKPHPACAIPDDTQDEALFENDVLKARQVGVGPDERTIGIRSGHQQSVAGHGAMFGAFHTESDVGLRPASAERRSEAQSRSSRVRVEPRVLTDVLTRYECHHQGRRCTDTRGNCEGADRRRSTEIYPRS